MGHENSLGQTPGVYRSNIWPSGDKRAVGGQLGWLGFGAGPAYQLIELLDGMGMGKGEGRAAFQRITL